MRAAVLVAPGAPLALVDGLRCPPPARGQVLVRLAYSGVCHSQLMEARGLRGPDPWLPHLLGHEGSGRVLAIGEGVTKVEPGDAVVLGWLRGEGIEAGGMRYEGPEPGVSYNAGAVTTFNELALVSENRVVRLPAGMPLDVAALLGCAVPTGAGMVLNELAPPPGSRVAIFGLGGLGLAALMAARLCGCARLVAIDVVKGKLELAASLGADAVIDARQEDPVTRLRELTGGAGVDFAVEATGRALGIEQALAAVRRGGGRCVFASHPAHGERISLDPYELIAGKQLQGSWGGGSQPDRDVPRFAAMYLAGQLPLDVLLSKRYPLEQVNQALADLEAGRVSRPLLVIDPACG